MVYMKFSNRKVSVKIKIALMVESFDRFINIINT